MSAPKPPTPKKVNPYEGLTSDPEFAKAAEELGYTSVNKDHEVAAVKEYMLKSTIDDERRDKAFRKAEKQLYKDGTLEYAEGTKGKQGRIDSSDTEWELQKIYDQMYDNDQAKADKAYDRRHATSMVKVCLANAIVVPVCRITSTACLRWCTGSF